MTVSERSQLIGDIVTWINILNHRVKPSIRYRFEESPHSAFVGTIVMDRDGSGSIAISPEGMQLHSLLHFVQGMLAVRKTACPETGFKDDLGHYHMGGDHLP